MKTNSRKILTFLFFAGAIFVAGSYFSLAVPGPEGRGMGNPRKMENEKFSEEGESEVKSQAQEKFCERISEISSKNKQRFSERKNTLQVRAQEREMKLGEKQNEKDEKIAEIRSKREAYLEESFQKLEEKATEEEQKEAVNKFQEAVRTAIEARRGSLDAAILTFRTEMKKLQEKRKGSVEEDGQDFVSLQEKAFLKAKSDCEKGLDPATIRQNLRTALSSGQKEFSKNKEDLEKIRVEAQKLIDARKEAFSKANTDFRLAMEKARNEIKAVFSEADEDESIEEESAEETEQE